MERYLSGRTFPPDYKTIGNIINGETVGTINNVVLMCLAANLPWDMSDYLIQRSGHQLLYNSSLAKSVFNAH